MRRFIAPVLILMIVLSVRIASVPGRETPSSSPSLDVRVGIFSNEPLTCIDENDTPHGFIVDILDAVAEEEHWNIRYITGTRTACLEKLRTAEIDLLPGIEYTAAMAERFNFTDESLLSDWYVVYAGKPEKFVSIHDLDNRRVAVFKENVFFPEMERLAGRFGLKCRFIGAASYEDVLDAVENGRADAGLLTHLYALRHYDRCRGKKTGVECCPLELRFGMPGGGVLNGVLGKAVDRHLREWKQDTSSIYYKARNRWLAEEPGKAPPAYPSWLFPALILLIVSIVIINQVMRYRMKVLTRDMRNKHEALLREVEERRRVETQLKEARDRYRHLFDGIQDAVVVHNLAPGNEGYGRIIEANNQLLDMLGYRKHELIGMRLADIVAPERLEKPSIAIEQLKTKRQISFESVLMTRTGRRIPVEIVCSIFEMDGTPAIISSARDVSRKKKAREILQRRLIYLDGLYQVSRVFLEKLEYGKIIEQVCRFCVDVFKADAGWIGKIHVNDKDVIIECCCGTAAEKAGYIRADGLEKLSGTSPVSRAYRSKTMQVVNHLDNGHSEEDWRNQLIHLGFQSMGCFPMIQNDRVTNILCVYSSRRDFFTIELAELFQALANLGAVAFARSGLYEQLREHAVILERRVSERTRELEEINRELERFAYSISHDLKSPLRAVQGFLNALEENTENILTQDAHNLIVRIRQTIRRMDEMIGELLAYSRVCHTKVTLLPVRLSAAVAEVLLALELEIKNADADIDFEVDMPSVLANESILKQAIQNLVSNALIFTVPGRKPRIRIRAERRDAACRLWVEDNGIGIDPAYSERVFDLFERLHGIETYPGTGIGLAVVKKGIERMGGRVGVSSEPGEGSRFWVELPLASSQEGSGLVRERNN